MIFSTVDRAKKKTNVILALIVFHGFMIIGVILAVKSSEDEEDEDEEVDKMFPTTMANVSSTAASAIAVTLGSLENRTAIVEGKYGGQRFLSCNQSMCSASEYCFDN